MRGRKHVPPLHPHSVLPLHPLSFPANLRANLKSISPPVHSETFVRFYELFSARSY